MKFWYFKIVSLISEDSRESVQALTKYRSGCGLAISSAKEGKSGFIYNFVKSL